MPAEIIEIEEMEKFVRTHMAHRVTSLLSPIVRSDNDHAAWGNRNDTYRAAKEGSYVMLRLLIEFLGVKGSRKNEGRLAEAGTDDDDDLRLSSFLKWGAVSLRPTDFGADESFVADTHRTLCKINAHFTYDDRKPDYYDRIASLPDLDWERGIELVLTKLHSEFYVKVGQPIVVHEDFVGVCRARFPAFNFVGGKLAKT
ncbi:MAG: hypothetical protein NTV08_00965 [Verrucomicrobia bacterium]|nr:hypothetical protein [Verrucomicrobiota bacterium]